MVDGDSASSTETLIDGESARKRRRMIGSLRVGTDLFRLKDTVASTIFHVSSEASSEDFYQIAFRIKDGTPRFACSCGIPFGIPERNHCKHVGRLVAYLMKTYVDNYMGTVEEDLAKMFETMLQIM